MGIAGTAMQKQKRGDKRVELGKSNGGRDGPMPFCFLWACAFRSLIVSEASLSGRRLGEALPAEGTTLSPLELLDGQGNGGGVRPPWKRRDVSRQCAPAAVLPFYEGEARPADAGRGGDASPIDGWMGSETLLLFIAALFDNSHNERSNYHG